MWKDGQHTQAEGWPVKEHPRKVNSLHFAGRKDLGPVFFATHAVFVDKVTEVHQTEDALSTLRVRCDT